MVAIPSGFGVVLAITGGSPNALVGVAIAAALLPPIVNAGLCFALSFWWQVLDPKANWWRDLHDAMAGQWAGLLAMGGAAAVPSKATTTTVTTTTTATEEVGSSAPTAADAADVAAAAGPLTNVTLTNVTLTTVTTTTTTTTSRVSSSSAADAVADAAAAAAGGCTGLCHPYLVVALHGFWSFVLFVLNLVCIIGVGVATFWLKGVSNTSSDSSGAAIRLGGEWEAAFLRLQGDPITLAGAQAFAELRGAFAPEARCQEARGHSGHRFMAELETLGGSRSRGAGGPGSASGPGGARAHAQPHAQGAREDLL